MRTTSLGSHFHFAGKPCLFSFVSGKTTIRSSTDFRFIFESSANAYNLSFFSLYGCYYKTYVLGQSRMPVNPGLAQFKLHIRFDQS